MSHRHHYHYHWPLLLLALVLLLVATKAHVGCGLARLANYNGPYDKLFYDQSETDYLPDLERWMVNDSPPVHHPIGKIKLTSPPVVAGHAKKGVRRTWFTSKEGFENGARLLETEKVTAASDNREQIPIDDVVSKLDFYNQHVDNLIRTIPA